MSDTRRARVYRVAAACLTVVAVVVCGVLVVGMLPTLTMALMFGGAKALELGLGAAAFVFVLVAAAVAVGALAQRVRTH